MPMSTTSSLHLTDEELADLIDDRAEAYELIVEALDARIARAARSFVLNKIARAGIHLSRPQELEVDWYLTAYNWPRTGVARESLFRCLFEKVCELGASAFVRLQASDAGLAEKKLVVSRHDHSDHHYLKIEVVDAASIV